MRFVSGCEHSATLHLCDFSNSDVDLLLWSVKKEFCKTKLFALLRAANTSDGTKGRNVFVWTRLCCASRLPAFVMEKAMVYGNDYSPSGTSQHFPPRCWGNIILLSCKHEESVKDEWESRNQKSCGMQGRWRSVQIEWVWHLCARIAQNLSFPHWLLVKLDRKSWRRFTSSQLIPCSSGFRSDGANCSGGCCHSEQTRRKLRPWIRPRTLQQVSCVVISQTISSLASQKRLVSEAGISLFIGFHHTIWWVVLTIQVRCVTPHSSPTRGHWPQQPFLTYIYNFAIIIIHKHENSWI